MPQEERGGEGRGKGWERGFSFLQGGNEETEWSRTKADFTRNGMSLGPSVKIGEKIKKR